MMISCDTIVRERTMLPYLVLDLGLDIIDGIGRLKLEGDLSFQ